MFQAWVYLCCRYLFISLDEKSISRYYSDGSNGKVIVKNKLMKVTGMVADPIMQRLYFADAVRDVIEMCDYYGKSRYFNFSLYCSIGRLGVLCNGPPKSEVC